MIGSLYENGMKSVQGLADDTHPKYNIFEIIHVRQYYYLIINHNWCNVVGWKYDDVIL